jgi:hypothetical protein
MISSVTDTLGWSKFILRIIYITMDPWGEDACNHTYVLCNFYETVDRALLGLVRKHGF